MTSELETFRHSMIEACIRHRVAALEVLEAPFGVNDPEVGGPSLRLVVAFLPGPVEDQGTLGARLKEDLEAALGRGVQLLDAANAGSAVATLRASRRLVYGR